VISRNGRSIRAVTCIAPWPDERTCGLIHPRTPTIKPQERRQAQPIQHCLAERDAAHDHNACSRSRKTDDARNREILAGHTRYIECSDSERTRLEQVGNEIAHERRQSDGSQACRGVASDNELEAIKRAGNGRPKRAGNGARRSASDKRAKIAAAQVKCATEPGRDPARKLRVAGLQPHGRAYSTRPDRLQTDVHAADERHAAAMQSVGLNRIDFPGRPPARHHDQREAEDQAAKRRNRQRRREIKRGLCRKPLAGFEPKEQRMERVDGKAHHRDDNACQGSHRGSKKQKARLPRAHKGAQRARNLQ
jgi:hypothetical protein